MDAMTSLLRWGSVLGIALLLPVTLPAGGGERTQCEIRRREGASPFLIGKTCELRSSPIAVAPSLRNLQVGTPVSVLRTWESSNGDEWLQIKINTSEFMNSPSEVRRGWVHV